MNTVDWENKFNAIVRDTVHNLDRVKDRLESTKAGSFVVDKNSETELFPSSASNSRELSSYFGGPYSNPVFHSPDAAVTDVVSTDVMADTDVRYAALESSPSVIALLNDKLDSQSKVIEELARRLQKSDDMREHHMHEIHSLRDEMSRVRGRVAERGVDLATEQKLVMFQQQWSTELQSVHSQLLSLHTRLDEMSTKNAATSTALLELQRFTNSEVDFMRRELHSLKNKIDRVEVDVTNLSLHHHTANQHESDYNRSNNNAAAWNSPSTDGPLNKASNVSFCTPSQADAASQALHALGPGVDASKFRYEDLQKKLAELESQFLSDPRFSSAGRSQSGRRSRHKRSSVHRRNARCYGETECNMSDVDISTATDTMTLYDSRQQPARQPTFSSDDALQTTDALSDLSTDEDDSFILLSID